MSRPTVVNLGIRWLTSITFPRIMSLGLQTSPMNRSNLGLELEMCSIPVNGGCCFLPSHTTIFKKGIFSFSFFTTPMNLGPFLCTARGAAGGFYDYVGRV